MRMSRRDRRWSFVVSRSLFAVRCPLFVVRPKVEALNLRFSPQSWAKVCRVSFPILELCHRCSGTPSPTRYIRIKTLGSISRQSLERKGVRGKVWTTKELGVTFSESHPAWPRLSLLSKLSKTKRLWCSLALTSILPKDVNRDRWQRPRPGGTWTGTFEGDFESITWAVPLG
jgi:hypothetical protein